MRRQCHMHVPHKIGVGEHMCAVRPVRNAQGINAGAGVLGATRQCDGCSQARRKRSPV